MDFLGILWISIKAYLNNFKNNLGWFLVFESCFNFFKA
jgi:hypothetical protein